MTVVFMFNVVNRVANVFNIAPEWTIFGREGWRRRVAQWVMSMGLPWHMSLQPLAESEQVKPARDLAMPAEQIGLPAELLSVLWNELNNIPSIRTAVYQLFWTSLTCSKLDSHILRQLVEAVVGKVDSSDKLTSDGLGAFCEGLFHHPFAGAVSNFNAVHVDLTDEEKLDVVFRVSIAAAVEKMRQFHQAVLPSAWKSVVK